MLLEDQIEIWAVRWKLAHKFITQIAWQVYAIDIKHHLFVRVLWLLYKTLNVAHKLQFLWYFYDMFRAWEPVVTVCYYWMEKSSLDISFSVPRQKEDHTDLVQREGE